MTLQNLEDQLRNLTPTEKVLAIQTLMPTVGSGARGIVKLPGVMGGEACLANTRLPIWLFVELQNQGMNDADLLEAYPYLTAGDLVNIWAYADAYPEEIQLALEKQASAMQLDP